MTRIVGQKEFTLQQISVYRKKAQDESLSDEEREKARRAVVEMQAYNVRSLRGDFERY